LSEAAYANDCVDPSARDFQTDVPATAKARRSYVLCCGIMGRQADDDWLTVDAVRHWRTWYCGAIP